MHRVGDAGQRRQILLIPDPQLDKWRDAWAAFTTVAIIYPGIGTADPNSSLPSGFAGERLQYTLSQVIPLAAMVLIGLGLYALGRRTHSRESASSEPAVSERPGR